jgi:hypothetical protein
MKATLNSMLDHAMKQYGLDRSYTISYNSFGNTPFVDVREDNVLLASFLVKDGEMHSTIYHV